MEIDSLYSEIITEHSRSKRNKRELERRTVVQNGVNPSCGDELSLELLAEDGRITDAAFTGVGCAISQASSSMMADVIRGKSLDEAARLCSAFLGMIKGQVPDAATMDALEDAAALQGVSKMPARVKCAVLPWHTLERALRAIDG
ncbi:MAG: SUF system NifU family Fe-S cluster assembly protein [Oscillospiraceae bacterium]|jgi:nitrogen fixation NifU-like protein|nr:SUF system NifU family Fe-S cluster assembly protein [Oscillospiraceae bacterium]